MLDSAPLHEELVKFFTMTKINNALQSKTKSEPLSSFRKQSPAHCGGGKSSEAEGEERERRGVEWSGEERRGEERRGEESVGRGAWGVGKREREMEREREQEGECV